MNIALPALMIILGLLPGIVFFYGYYSGRFSKRLAAISGVAEIALWVAFAVPIDALALLVTSWLGIELDHELVARVALGQAGTQDVAADLARNLARRGREGWALTMTTYSAVLLLSFLAGNLIRKIVWWARLDVHFPFFRMRHEWFYILQGRLPALPRVVAAYVDVLIEEPGGVQLYQGIVSSFDVDREGGISQLILREAYKDVGSYSLPQTVSDKDAPTGKHARSWKRIPGDRFIIMGTAIRSINMRYVVSVPAAAPSGWGVFLDRVRGWFSRRPR